MGSLLDVRRRRNRITAWEGTRAQASSRWRSPGSEVVLRDEGPRARPCWPPAPLSTAVLLPPDPPVGPDAADTAHARDPRARAIRAYFDELFDEPLATTATAVALVRFAAVPGQFSGDATGAEGCLLQIARAAAEGELLALPTPARPVPVTASMGDENARSRPTNVSAAMAAIAGAAVTVALVRRRVRTD